MSKHSDAIDPEPVDVDFEPAADAPDADERPPVRGVGLPVVLFFFLLSTLGGAVLGYGAHFVQPAPATQLEAGSDPQVSAAAFAALQARLTELEARPEPRFDSSALDAEMTDFSDRLTAIEARSVTREGDGGETSTVGVAPAIVEALEARVSALEAAPEPTAQQPEVRPADLEALSVQIGALGQRIGTLEGVVSDLDARVTQLPIRDDQTASSEVAEAVDLSPLVARIERLEQAPVPETDVSDVEDRLVTLTRRIDRVDSRMDDLAGQTAATGTDPDRQLASRALALTALLDRAETDQPFEAERAALARIWRRQPDLDSLRDFSRTGVATRDSIRADFPEELILAADNDGEALFGLIRYRQTHADEADAVGALALVPLIKARLADQDLEGAILLTERLPEASLAAARDWLLQVRARQSVDDHLAALSDDLTRQALDMEEDPS
ncbi:COG4223 family protein [Maricaulis sp. D1M11]|uniref:COG4223 family protein n=1 Tax=Maricaulis sp. D1M11 TaxID=3076117 RepID=UPI0039B6D842